MKIKLKIKIKTFVGEFSRSRSSWTDFLQTQPAHESRAVFIVCFLYHCAVIHQLRLASIKRSFRIYMKLN